ncbi:seipin-2-like [Macadamia integrifolia]|uniref:seipin-2-like n=1 Tax=Macadamia integrifolia TaxID=60698 RepID=UPI001C533AC7|nr:seipin-2-like [Macadamia integrifolia]
MENTKIGEDPNSDPFFDAVEQSPSVDCTGEDESGEPTELLKHRIVEDGFSEVILGDKHSSVTTLPNGLRRRRSFRHNREGSYGNDDKNASSDSPVISEVTHVSESLFPVEKRNEFLRTLKDHEQVRESFESPQLRSSPGPIISVQEEDSHLDSTVTSANNERVGDSATGDSHVDSTVTSAKHERVEDSTTGDYHVGNLDETSSSFLIFLAGLVVKAIGFQFSILIRFITFPIWLSYYSFMLVIDPFRTVRRAKRYLTARIFGIWDMFWASVSPYMFERLKGHKIGTLIARFGYGIFWSVYVCFMLCGLLILAFVMGGFMMRYIVEEPIQLTEKLNFDYTKRSPVAYVPLTHCSAGLCGSDCKGQDEVKYYVGLRVIPQNQKLELTISLTLPESEYNKKLGVFQVRVDFLSANGRVASSLKDPCMLRFKSEPIHYLETFLKTAPLVAGYSSESQNLNLKMRGFTEGKEPTACLRVVLEQRAEYKPGAGIPEIYDASLVIESDLPLFKRIVWYWKKTIYIWTSLSLLMMELLLALVCCRPILIPRAKPRNSSTANNSSRQNTGAGS